MDARQRARMMVAHTVFQALRSADFRNDTPETNASGERVIVPALLDDTMGEFFDQFVAAQGTIYIAALEGTDVVVITMAPAHTARHAAPSEEECPIHRRTELAMVIEYLRARRRPVKFCEAPSNVLLELVDERPAVQV